MAASTSQSFTPSPFVPPPVRGSGADRSVPANIGLQVIRRNGSFSAFDPNKISVAITKTFIAVEGTAAAASPRIREAVEKLTQHIVETLRRRTDVSRALHIEDIQDQVELALMRSGEHKIARAYVLYREERAQERRGREQQVTSIFQPRLHVRFKDGRTQALDEFRLQQEIAAACEGIDGVSPESVMAEVRRNLYDGIHTSQSEPIWPLPPRLPPIPSAFS